MLRTSITAFALTCALFVAVSFLGPLHRSIDTIAMALPFFGIGAFAGVLSSRQIVLRLFCSTAAIAACITLAGYFLPQEGSEDLRIYSKNLWFANSEILALVNDIESANVDIVMLQEVSDRNRDILDKLDASFPFQHLCRFSAWSGIAIASRHPFDGPPVCSQRRAVAVAPIAVDGRRLTAVSIHLPWPWPEDSAANESDAQAILSALEGRIIVAGDFNILPWSGRARRISKATDTRIAGPVRPTLTFKRVPLPIDFALAPGGGSVRVRPLLGSDHAGIVADLNVW